MREREQLNYRFVLILLVVSLLIGWDYWIQLFLFFTPFTPIGRGYADFHTFYLAGRSWLLGKNPYPTSAVVGDLFIYPLNSFVYPPTSLPFFGAYALFNLHDAGQLWVATYYALFLMALVALAYAFGGVRRLFFIAISTVLLFTSHPLLLQMQLGQSDMIVSSLAMLALAALKLNRQFLSAALLSLGVLVKGPPAALLLIYFVVYLRSVRYLAEFLLTTATIVLASLFLVPLEWYTSYLHVVMGLMGVGGGGLPCCSLVPLPNLEWLNGIVLGAGFAALTIFMWKYGKVRFPSDTRIVLGDSMFLLNVLLLLLLNPKTHIETYVWVILPLGIFLSGLLLTQVRVGYLALVGVGIFLLIASAEPQYLNYQVLPFYLIGNLLTTILLVVAIVRPNVCWRYL